MGGVNFTRNRAWWHTAMWDEYGQRHQYITTFPTILCLMPLYWYGAMANRNIEQNYAAKMYQLDYEQRRNRLTHNMIMEHFEMHVEKAQDVFDQIKEFGFEKAFEYEIKNPIQIVERLHPKGIVNKELAAEKDEYKGATGEVNNVIEHMDLPYWLRKEIDSYAIRRKTPYAPYKYLPDANIDFHRTTSMAPYYVDPIEKMPEFKPKSE
jgi:hypothetical protein